MPKPVTTLSVVLSLTIGWSLLLTPPFAQLRDPIETSSTRQGQAIYADASDAGPGDVESRGVPLQGAVVQGDQLRTSPGYILEKGTNNQMTVRSKAGGGSDWTLNCGCVQGTGSCIPTVSNSPLGVPSGPTGLPQDVAVCAKSPNGPCTGQCGWTLAPTKVAPLRGR